MRLFLAVALAKLVRFAARLRGGGSALPGLVLLRIVPDALRRSLGSLPKGVIFVTGSNGKSTTTAMLVGILRAHGLKVFSNPAGGNLPQGLASALVGQSTLRGTVSADIAVLEVDEAYGPQIAQLITPSWVVFTNIQLDQLNRFGEPEAVFEMLQTLAGYATTGVLVNGSDPNTAALGVALASQGARVEQMSVSAEATASAQHGLVAAPLFFEDATPLDMQPTATVLRVDGSVVELATDSAQVSLAMPHQGLHYAVDAGLAVAMARHVTPDFSLSRAAQALEHSTPVYGRGEVIRYRGRDISLTMMKNLPSLQANLDSFNEPLQHVWISVDEGTPDPSWIFDVDTRAIGSVSVVSGSKASQWALLLEHRGIAYDSVVEDTATAMNTFVDSAQEPAALLHAIVNYEQMMLIRRIAGYKELEGAS